MSLLRSAAIGLALSVIGAGGAIAAEQMACCKDKKPCCEPKDGKPAACCEEHKPKPDAPKPSPEAQHQH